jgi:hypothetical protein
MDAVYFSAYVFFGERAGGIGLPGWFGFGGGWQWEPFF